VLVHEGHVIAMGYNQPIGSHDPTAHAEIVAIRDACKNLISFQLDGCTIYTSCEPCPMCLGAIYWSRPERIFFAATRGDAAAAGFDDELFYDEMEKPNDLRQLRMETLLREESQRVFANWIDKTDKTEY